MFPVESVIPEIKRKLEDNLDVVLTAPPGSGKTTQVPAALLEEPWLEGKKILMLEPRRIAARNSARFIAKKFGEKPGGIVGYSVRLEREVSARTRLEIVTEGLLTQRLMSDPELSDVGLVIFDEFHERSLQCDLSFALALEVRRALRPDLRLMVMSATLDAEEVSSHLDNPVLVQAEGRMFPVETRYLGDVSMGAAISRALKETEGDVLCFLPGEGEIRKTAERLSEVVSDKCLVLSLYGSLPKEAQDRVFEKSEKRKVILATSIAETSVTLEGITCVIDSGLMRVPRFNSSTGMSGLVTLPLSLDRAEQRRGRAGRVREGTCYRLWNENENLIRPKKMTPEILDADLTSLVLTSYLWGAKKRTDLPWVTEPADNHWNQAVELLKLLGAIDNKGDLTPKGKKMGTVPMHPRLANMILSGGDSLIAAIIEEGVKIRETDIRKINPTPRIKELAKRFDKFRSSTLNLQPSTLSEGGALALAYPDRIAKNRGNGKFRMVSGKGAFFDDNDPLAKKDYIVVAEVDDRDGDAKVFLASPIEEEEILELFGDRLAEEDFCEWDKRNERVKAVTKVKIGEMVIKEKVKGKGQGEGQGEEWSSRVLVAFMEGVRAKGLKNLPCYSDKLLNRINFVARHVEGWEELTDEKIFAAMEGFAQGMTRLKDLEKLDFAAVVDFALSEMGHDRRELDLLAPVKMEVPTGSNMTIHYEGDEPTVEVRLQECFGLMETPKVAGGKIPIVMTLLSPAHRPIQITKDLKTFWQEGYNLVRKDMRGRYPKHYWPEDPFTAVATRKTRPEI